MLCKYRRTQYIAERAEIYICPFLYIFINCYIYYIWYVSIYIFILHRVRLLLSVKILAWLVLVVQKNAERARKTEKNGGNDRTERLTR